MKSIHAALAAFVALQLGLLWAFLPERGGCGLQPPIAQQAQQQCPANSTLDGKLCTCPEGSSWSGSACTQVWSAAPPSITPEPSALTLPAPRAGSMVRMDRVVGDFTGTGNIAIVEDVGVASLTIIEGDHRTGALTRRSASGKDLPDAARKLGIATYLTP